MKNPDPGYLLPEGEAYTDDFACQLVYIPNKDEYWRAFLGAMHYFANWVAWERDTDKRGKDAAQAWREANELTWECWRMTCLDDITDRMDIMIDLLANQPGCCDTTTIGPIIITTTIIVPGVGDDPTHWGETEVADWGEWLEYICYHAHRYVDILIDGARGLDVAVQLGSYTLEFLSLLHQLQRFTYKGYPINLSDVMEIYQGFKDAVDLVEEFDGLADRFESARQEIVCSFIQGSSLSDAVEDAVDNNVLWLLFYVWTDYASVQAMIYEGTFDGVGFLPAIKRDDCECETPGLYTFTWDTTVQGWSSTGMAYFGWYAALQCLEGIANTTSTWRTARCSGATFYTLSGLSSPQYVRKVGYRMRLDTGGGSELTCSWRVRIRDGAGTYYYGPVHTDAEVTWNGGWYSFEDDVGFDCQIHTTDSNSIAIEHYHASGGWDIERFRWDNYKLIAP